MNNEIMKCGLSDDFIVYHNYHIIVITNTKNFPLIISV